MNKKFLLSLSIVALLSTVAFFSVQFIQQKRSLSTIAPSMEITGWQTYKNEQYGFEFKYKNDWVIKEEIPSNEKTLTKVSITPPKPSVNSFSVSIESGLVESYRKKDLGPYFESKDVSFGVDNITAIENKFGDTGYISNSFIMQLDNEHVIIASLISDHNLYENGIEIPKQDIQVFWGSFKFTK